MRLYLLDTGPLTAYLMERPAAVELITPLLQNHELTTSILVYGEMIEYIKSFPDYSERRIQLIQLLTEITPHFLTYDILERYADIRRYLRQRGGLIGDIDTLIAATALEHELIVVTSDSDFERVPNLKTIVISKETLRRR
jgi:tRNA(fMet)-specific endonuclease VapC